MELKKYFIIIILLNLTNILYAINLITDSKNKNIYNIELIAKNKIIYFYEWHLEIGSTENCKNCWFTTIVSPPINNGNTI